jgi:hypothetical protein
MASYCPKCGSKVFNESIFCDYCGNKLKNRNSTRRYDNHFLDDSPRTFSNKSVPINSSRVSSPYNYYSYHKPSSSGIKWIVIGFFAIGILGLAALSVFFIGIISMQTISNEYEVRIVGDVDFSITEYSLSLVQPGEYHISAKIQNDGDSLANSGLIPISWEDIVYELQLYDGVGILDENIIGSDLNGNGNVSDSFRVEWCDDDDRKWDAKINNGSHEIHAYSISEGSVRNPVSIRTYYINGESKLFKLGNQTHTLYIANNDYALFGLNQVILKNHPGPCFEILANPNVIISELEINGESVSIEYNHTLDYNLIWRQKATTAYIIPIPESGLLPGEEIILSGTLKSNSPLTSDIRLFINWSLYGSVRHLWTIFDRYDVAF